MNEDYAEVRARLKASRRLLLTEYQRAEQLLAENQRLRDQLAAIKREWQYGTDEVHATPWRRRMAWLIGDEKELKQSFSLRHTQAEN